MSTHLYGNILYNTEDVSPGDPDDVPFRHNRFFDAEYLTPDTRRRLLHHCRHLGPKYVFFAPHRTDYGWLWWLTSEGRTAPLEVPGRYVDLEWTMGVWRCGECYGMGGPDRGHRELWEAFRELDWELLVRRTSPEQLMAWLDEIPG